ncbi:MAG: tRNA dihydrouridine synthase DusB [Planctomycetes bacterium]|nr:tRNA dihydrouridine synthase DusB [Planctomycetota bacterium]
MSLDARARRRRMNPPPNLPLRGGGVKCIMLKIGNVQLATNLLLAPIAGHCDLPFRRVAREAGSVGLAFTDLLCPHGILKQNEQTQWLAATDPLDQPLGMQLYGSDPDMMAAAAQWSAANGATTIDINMGCPVDKVTKTFAGSMMLCTPDHTVGVAERLVKTVNLPVTAKLRLGYEQGELTAPELAKRLIGVGVAAITIHGRTAAQRFKGSACLDGIARVVEAVHTAGGGRVPCIGNGDIRTPFDVQRMLRHTGCDGVMIARAALGAPWIFRDTHELITTGAITHELTLRQRLELVKMQFHLMRAMRGDRRTVSRMRQCISGYAVHLGPCKPLKAAIQSMKPQDAGRFDEMVDTFIETSGQAAECVPVSWSQRADQLAASALSVVH